MDSGDKVFPSVISADGSDFASEQVQKRFIQNILDLGSQYSTIAKEDSSPFAVRCAEMQLLFLMSSDLYERRGLLNVLLEVLEEDLATSITESEVDESEGDVTALRRRSNALAILARIPLEPIPVDQANKIFDKLLELDKHFVRMPGKTMGNVDFLVVVRRALIRFVAVVRKSTVEVSFCASPSLTYRIRL